MTLNGNTRAGLLPPLLSGDLPKQVTRPHRDDEAPGDQGNPNFSDIFESDTRLRLNSTNAFQAASSIFYIALPTVYHAKSGLDSAS